MFLQVTAMSEEDSRPQRKPSSCWEQGCCITQANSEAGILLRIGLEPPFCIGAECAQFPAPNSPRVGQKDQVHRPCFPEKQTHREL